MEVSGRFDAVSLTMEGGLKVTFLIADKEKALQRGKKGVKNEDY